MKESNAVSYMPQLDGLRALAALAVIVHHFGGQGLTQSIDIGKPAVRLFFVLSGFLITSILLGARRSLNDGAGTRSQVIKAFYARRALRIFPPYYVAIFVAATVGISAYTEPFWWHTTYLSNVYMAFTREWNGPASHLWSLAVEEQFYLVWPFLVLFVPARHLASLVIGLIVTAPIFRTIIYLFTKSEVSSLLLMPACLDSLGAGALLAIYQKNSNKDSIRKVISILGWVGGLAVSLLLVMRFADVGYKLCVAMTDLCYAALFTWVIYSAVNRKLPSALETRPLLYLGQISYGVYLYHMLIPILIWEPGPFLAENLPAHLAVFLRLLFIMAASIGLASLSWFVLERPMQRLKNRFPYLPQPNGK